MIFYYSFPSALKILTSTPEWLVALVYSFICTYSAAVIYDLLNDWLSLIIMFMTGLVMILLITKIKSHKATWVKLLSAFIFIALVVVASAVVIPIFWPDPLIMLSLYLFVVFCGILWLVSLILD
jgi:hypothetical protein